MKAIFINPSSQTVESIELPDPDDPAYMETLHKKIGWLDTVRISKNGDVILVDDEGRIRGDFPKAGFRLDHYDWDLAGPGIVVGTDHEGESTAPMITRRELRERITWVTIAEPLGQPAWKFLAVVKKEDSQ